MPSVVIAQSVGSQIVVFGMLPTTAVSAHVVGLPFFIDLSTADMAPSVCLGEYSLPLVRRQSLPRGSTLLSFSAMKLRVPTLRLAGLLPRRRPTRLLRPEARLAAGRNMPR